MKPLTGLEKEMLEKDVNTRTIAIVGSGEAGLHEAVLAAHRMEAKTVLLVEEPQEQTVVNRMQKLLEVIKYTAPTIHGFAQKSGRELRRERRKRERQSKKH